MLQNAIWMKRRAATLRNPHFLGEPGKAAGREAIFLLDSRTDVPRTQPETTLLTGRGLVLDQAWDEKVARQRKLKLFLCSCWAPGNIR